FSVEDELRKLRLPTLIAIGDEDEPCVDVAVFLKRVLPSAGLLVLPQSGHTINLEEPAVFNSAVREFLRLVQDERWSSRSVVTTRLLTAGAGSTPVVRGQRLFYQRRSGLQDQPVLVLCEAPCADERTIVDPNALSAAGTIALDWWFPSRTGRLLAYGTSEGGTELSTLRVLDVESGVDLGDEPIQYTRAASVAWLPDDSGFYYTRYPTHGSVLPGDEMYHRHVFFHALGQDWRDDAEYYGAGRAREDWPKVELLLRGWLHGMVG